jgi:single-stranded-DNA-specific exonuclease
MAKWMVAAKKADFAGIAKACDISVVTARLIRNRGVIGTEATKKYIHGTMNDLIDPMRLPDMQKAVELIRSAIREKKKIRIFGDYDVDGICSTYIFYATLTHLGADVSTVLPDRVKDGYGLNPHMVDQALQDGVQVMITCDNGIAAFEGAKRAKDAGVTVIITDHHEIPYEEKDGKLCHHLPEADAIVEPKLTDSLGIPYYPFVDICGAMVAFKVCEVLLNMPDITGEPEIWQSPEQGLLRELSGFAALATVCDVMPLQNENRIIVRYGLQELARSRNLGMRSLVEAVGLKDMPITCYHAGFVLGPCLNASGRLENATMALQLFKEKNLTEATKIAEELKELNESRKELTEKGYEEARKLLDEKESLDRVLVVYLPESMETIVGIVAARIKEHYFRPTIVLTDAKEGEGFLKGSARSIEGYDMYAEMNRCADLFEAFGGHKMAAGCTLKKENLDELTRRLNENCTLTDEDLQNTIHIDMELPLHYVSLPMTKEMEVLEPCGTGNSRAMFVVRNLTLEFIECIGRRRNVCKFRGKDEKGHAYNMIWFTPATEIPDLACATPHLCHVVYYPSINEWHGIRELQFVIKDVRIVRQSS